MSIATTGGAPATMNSTVDQDSFPGVPGHGTSMHPGHDTKAHFSPRVAQKYRGMQRESSPVYPGGMGGAADPGDGE